MLRVSILCVRGIDLGSFLNLELFRRCGMFLFFISLIKPIFKDSKLFFCSKHINILSDMFGLTVVSIVFVTVHFCNLGQTYLYSPKMLSKLFTY